MSSYELPVVAWLVNGGRVYRETVLISEGWADTRIAERNDGSTKCPLTTLATASARIAALEAECEGLRKDAERWRWVRKANAKAPEGRWFAYPDPAKLDEVIDDCIRAALSKQEGA